MSTLEIAKTLNIPYHAAEVWKEHEEKEEEKVNSYKDKNFIDFEIEPAPSLPSVLPNANSSQILHPIGFKVIPSVNLIELGPSAPIAGSFHHNPSNAFSKTNPNNEVQKGISPKPSAKPLKPGFIDMLQDLPDVPKGMPNLDISKDSMNNDEPFDFDDLSKRFDALKKRK